MCQINLEFFGPARDFAGANTLQIELSEGATVNDLAQHLVARLPSWAGMDVVRFAINDAFVEPTCELSDGDTVSVIPPVSGGMDERASDLIAVTPDPLDIAQCYAHLAGASTGDSGGVCVFIGKTRAETHEEHGQLSHLAYEAHDSMALAQMQRLATEARNRWAICSIVLSHRTGVVGIGEASVAIGVASGHRDESFVACRWLIDELKREVPIWKREVWSGGEKTWSGSDSSKAQQSGVS